MLTERDCNEIAELFTIANQALSDARGKILSKCDERSSPFGPALGITVRIRQTPKGDFLTDFHFRGGTPAGHIEDIHLRLIDDLITKLATKRDHLHKVIALEKEK